MVRIARLETFRVPPRWLFLRLETHDGIVGWGEPIVEGRTATVEAAVHELGTYLLQQPARGIEDVWQLLTRGGFYRGGPILSSAVAGIDQALWDIQGKRLGVPVHELLGGPVRDRIRVYTWIAGDRPDDVRESIRARLAQGYTAVKMNLTAEAAWMESPAFTTDVLGRLSAARDELGEHNELLLDLHGRLSPAMARRLLPLLEQFQPLFVEEPVVPELAEVALAGLAASATVPIAMGERFYSRAEFKRLLDAGVLVVQPDLSHAGGISEVRRIATLAETYGAALAPHCPLGPIALAASIQVDAASPNFLIQESSIGIHYNQGADVGDYLLDRDLVTVTDGHLQVPDGPGLGITVDEDAVRQAADPQLAWRAPVWHHRDGSLAEW